MAAAPPLTETQRAYLQAFDRLLYAQTGRDVTRARQAMATRLEQMRAEAKPTVKAA